MLNKSQYLIGRHCAKHLWLSKYLKNEAAPRTKGDKVRGKTGEELGKMARDLFPGGVLVAAEGHDQEFQIAETKRLLDSGAEALFEASFEANGLGARCDVLLREGSGFRIVEVKSSTKIKDEHLEDLAFQVYVLRLAGLVVTGASLCRVDSSQERGEAQLTPEELFVVEDATEPVEALLTQVADWSAEFVRVLESPLEPDIRTNVYCLNPSRCEFYAYCHEGVPQHDLVSLPGIRADRVVAFREAGYATIEEIPEGTKLTAQQQRAWEVLRFDRPFVDEGLQSTLGQIGFPAHFIDFEAAAPALPMFPGMRPYQAFPFQWSDQRLDAPESDPDADGYLHLEDSDPRQAFAATLHERIRDAKTIVFYSSYELTTVRALANAAVPFGQELVTLLESRGFDLYKAVKDHVYLAEFGGSYSIKKVLPALVPDLTYEVLAIKDGDTAAVEYMRMHALVTTEAERLEIALNLEAYCAVDTLAMVRLYQALLQLSYFPD